MAVLVRRELLGGKKTKKTPPPPQKKSVQLKYINLTVQLDLKT